MDAPATKPQIQPMRFTGADGNALIADCFLPVDGTPRSVILAHGGGQTRHAWRATAIALSQSGWRAITLDQRGHGDSDWVEDGDYEFETFARDLECVARAVNAQGCGVPAIVGASLGGIAAMLSGGDAHVSNYSAIVLVDITPNLKQDGVEKVVAFMAANAQVGFASVEDAADAVAKYLPHRARPSDLSGLAKNLRQSDDGRYRWHWDPKFLDSRVGTQRHVEEIAIRTAAVAKKISVPVMLVRGRDSELVGEAEARRFVELVPHAEIADVSGARHMVAGDRNDIFNDAVLGFLATL